MTNLQHHSPKLCDKNFRRTPGCSGGRTPGCSGGRSGQVICCATFAVKMLLLSGPAGGWENWSSHIVSRDGCGVATWGGRQFFGVAIRGGI